ncbi:MAG: GGDEF domain-containing protein [Bacillota bacterium]
MIATEDIIKKYRSLEKLNEKLTQLHWLVAQVAGENDLHTMHNLIINGFMQISEVAGCHFILLDENGCPTEIVRRNHENDPFGSCNAFKKILTHVNRIKNEELALPHQVFCEDCTETCGSGVLQILTLYGKHGNPLAILIAQYHETPSTSDETQIILELFTIQVSLTLENAMLNKKFENLSITDALTGLYNHRYFAEKMQKEIDLCSYMKKEMCLIMLDVDFFKSYNDNYGHPAGDVVLKTMGRIFRQVVRPKDIVARYGGEEFAFILPDTNLQEGIQLGERIRRSVENAVFPHRVVTASLGIANYPAHTTNAKELLKLADKALYQAKSAGRNRVGVALEE